ncbi:hypothetical protein MLD38_011682 [Melastoma candidum]|uniref:Uncharacterized protein n=1 Tax=Melastoma candidum TaxID=119954 RepID=A0ACB9R4Y2_9MYRT|nr:hypothetical protein MLD38_011682 [Melastoma candidum]
MLVPPWLESLLSTPFFSVCPSHRNSPRNECNMYCLDCCRGGGGDSTVSPSHAFCYYCRSSHHKDHLVVQIRRSSYHDVVRVSEIQQALDISGVQTYVINSARVVFLNERPQPRVANGCGGGVNNKGGVSHLCQICGRSLLDPFLFCSLGCKLVGIKRDGDLSFNLRAKKEEEGFPLTVARNKKKKSKEGISSLHSNGRPLLPCKGDEDEDDEEATLLEGNPDVVYSNSTTATRLQYPSTSSRRRKGVPRRAPL